MARLPRPAATARPHRAMAHSGFGAHAFGTKRADEPSEPAGARVAPLLGMLLILSILAGIAIAIAVTYAGHAWWGWVLGWIVPLARWVSVGGSWGLTLAIVIWVGLAIVTGVPAIRRRVVSGPALRRLAPRFPRMSETE